MENLKSIIKNSFQESLKIDREIIEDNNLTDIVQGEKDTRIEVTNRYEKEQKENTINISKLQ